MEDAVAVKAMTALREARALPHDENVLATLVNVHIVGGSADSVVEIEGATMRTAVVLALISELRVTIAVMRLKRDGASRAVALLERGPMLKGHFLIEKPLHRSV